MTGSNRRPPACKAGALPAELILHIGDPYGIRTRVTAVKGRCLNRLTNGPKLAPQVGFEPTTYRLTAGCSTTELLRNDLAWQRPILTGEIPQLLSALRRLTSVFGMGTGVAVSLSPPDFRACSLKTEDSSTQTIRLDQSLDRLVSFSSTCRHASTHDLSTSSSLRGLS